MSAATEHARLLATTVFDSCADDGEDLLETMICALAESVLALLAEIEGRAVSVESPQPAQKCARCNGTGTYRWSMSGLRGEGECFDCRGSGLVPATRGDSK